MKKTAKSAQDTIDRWPALRALRFRINGRMRCKASNDICVLGAEIRGCAFWVLNLTQGTKGVFTPGELVKHFQPLNEEGVA